MGQVLLFERADFYVLYIELYVWVLFSRTMELHLLCGDVCTATMMKLPVGLIRARKEQKVKVHMYYRRRERFERTRARSSAFNTSIGEQFVSVSLNNKLGN